MVLAVLAADTDPIVRPHLGGRRGPVDRADVDHRYSTVVEPPVVVADTGHDCRDCLEHPDYSASHLQNQSGVISIEWGKRRANRIFTISWISLGVWRWWIRLGIFCEVWVSSRLLRLKRSKVEDSLV